MEPGGAGADLYHFERTDSAHHVPAPHLVTSHWFLKTGRGRSIYTTEMGKHYKSGISHPSSWLLTIYQGVTRYNLGCRRQLVQSHLTERQLGESTAQMYPLSSLSSPENVQPNEKSEKREESVDIRSVSEKRVHCHSFRLTSQAVSRVDRMRQ